MLYKDSGRYVRIMFRIEMTSLAEVGWAPLPVTLPRLPTILRRIWIENALCYISLAVFLSLIHT